MKSSTFILSSLPILPFLITVNPTIWSCSKLLSTCFSLLDRVVFKTLTIVVVCSVFYKENLKIEKAILRNALISLNTQQLTGFSVKLQMQFLQALMNSLCLEDYQRPQAKHGHGLHGLTPYYRAEILQDTLSNDLWVFFILMQPSYMLFLFLLCIFFDLEEVTEFHWLIKKNNIVISVNLTISKCIFYI